MTERFVVITGAAGGIGKASVELFSEKGWYVFGIDRAPYPENFPELGTFIQADVSKEQDWTGINEKIIETTSTLDAIVNNAAIQVTKPLVETAVDDVLEVIREENSEDFYRMAGTGEKDPFHEPMMKKSFSRMPWLLVTLIGGLVTAGIMQHYEKGFPHFVKLIFFFPNSS